MALAKAAHAATPRDMHSRNPIARVGATLKFGAFAVCALWPTRADDSKHQCTFFLGVWAPPPGLTAPLGLVRGGQALPSVCGCN